uniref:Transposase n=1 Tax=Romanomermis culicivorax TaxID=13658 RepID=A0A915J2B9_ROMCU
MISHKTFLTAAGELLLVKLVKSVAVNVDETGLSTDVGCSKVLCAKGMQDNHQMVTDEVKLVFTIVGCGNAASNSVPLLVVYDGKNLWNDWCLEGLDSFRCAVTENGWMERRMDGWKQLVKDCCSKLIKLSFHQSYADNS